VFGAKRKARNYGASEHVPVDKVYGCAVTIDDQPPGASADPHPVANGALPSDPHVRRAGSSQRLRKPSPARGSQPTARRKVNVEGGGVVFDAPSDSRGFPRLSCFISPALSVRQGNLSFCSFFYNFWRSHVGPAALATRLVFARCGQ